MQIFIEHVAYFTYRQVEALLTIEWKRRQTEKLIWREIKRGEMGGGRVEGVLRISKEILSSLDKGTDDMREV